MSQSRNLLLTIRYQGTNYHGFQVQKNAVTVAQTLQDAMQAVLGVRDDIKGCSRTDSGVHANEFCVSFHTQSRIPCESLVRALNVKLPFDIAVTACREVPLDFHARYSCRGKRYVYQIHNSPVKDPFNWKRVYEYRYPLDEALCNRVCRDFLGTHDFSAFCAANSSVEDHVRTITACGMTRQGERVTFFVEGDGFLYNMVRIMVGTVLEIAAGSMEQDAIPRILAGKDRSAAGATAPAWGLYLDKVFYDSDVQGAQEEATTESWAR